MPETVLLIEDHEDTRTTLEMALKFNFNVISAKSRDEALQVLPRQLAAIVTDYSMLGMGMEEFLRRVRVQHSRVPVILVTGVADPAGIAERHDVAAWFQKPCEPFALVDKVSELAIPPPASVMPE